ncbi:MAG: DUF5698 domain-containing protein [Acidobacteria bacterium]|nr:DUF5698 domain-containing protein [Acidobacteriota bacterium]
MSSLLSELPVWGIGLAIFAMRVLDVTLGTMRTISVVHGHTRLAVVLGFIEICVWLTAVSEAVVRVGETPLLIEAFAGGFATGNAVGIMVERKLALGSCVVRMISSRNGHDVAVAISGIGRMVTTFAGTSDAGDRSLVYALCPRRMLPNLLSAAKAVDPEVYYAVERFAETGFLTPVVQPTGWRATFKKK